MSGRAGACVERGGLHTLNSYELPLLFFLILILCLLVCLSSQVIMSKKTPKKGEGKTEAKAEPVEPSMMSLDAMMAAVAVNVSPGKKGGGQQWIKELHYFCFKEVCVLCLLSIYSSFFLFLQKDEQNFKLIPSNKLTAELRKAIVDGNYNIVEANRYILKTPPDMRLEGTFVVKTKEDSFIAFRSLENTAVYCKEKGIKPVAMYIQ